MPPPSTGPLGTRVLRIMYPAALTLGGAERQMIILAERLPRDRFEVSFLSLGAWTSNADLAVAAGARVHALGASNRRSSSMPLFAAKVSAKTLEYIAICRRERYDIVDAWLYLSYGIAAVTRPFSRVPVLISGRRSLSGFKGSFGPLERTIDRIARRNSDVIVANSSAVAADVARREGVDLGSIRIIRNGVEIPDMDTDQRTLTRRHWGIAAEDVVIGCVGSMKPGKGQSRVVDLMPVLIRTHPSVRLVLVGGGPLLNTVSRQVDALGLRDRVIMTDDVADARPLYWAMDVVVSASDAEGLPNAVLEAAAAGRAIVATDAGGTPETIIDGETGLLVPIASDAELAAGLGRLVADEPLRRRLGSAAREHVAAHFGVARFVTETAALYEEMAALRRLTGHSPRPVG